MANPIYQQMQGQATSGRMGDFMQRLTQFRNSFSGDPRQQVQQLLNSGKVTQQQYDQAVNMANQMQKFLSGR